MPSVAEPTFVPVEACGMSKESVDEAAANIALKMGYKPGADLEPIVQKLGGQVTHQPLLEATEGGSLEVYPEKQSFLIRVSPFAGNLRNRFTIAHELGHYFLHSDIGKKRIQVNREGSDRAEWEANWFAAGFLMPASSSGLIGKNSRATSAR